MLILKHPLLFVSEDPPIQMLKSLKLLGCAQRPPSEARRALEGVQAQGLFQVQAP